MEDSQPSYLIVGAGVFGVSTAYELIKRNPTASVTIVDRDAFDADRRVAASWDWNKVVRADYDDIIYCALAIEAQDIFRTDPLWKPFFHESGIYWMCRTEYAKNVIENYRKLGRKADLAAVPVEEARQMYGGIFNHADYNGVKEVLVNKTSGWAAAGDCLRAVTEETIRIGVKYIVADVETLRFTSDGVCCGIRTTKGIDISASRTILCTGAFTPSLLEQSALRSGVPNLEAGNRIVAGGITTGMTRLNNSAYEKYASMPVGVQGYRVEQGPFIGSLPPTRDRELKWWGQTIFRNTCEVVPGRKISAPPARNDYGQWNIPNVLKDDINHARDVFYGMESNQWTMEKHRICWDAFTTSGDFIISPHSSAKGLFIATCGNFHGWKFFPVLGKYVVQMLEGSLNPELVEKWAWDRYRPDPAQNADWPRVEMNKHLRNLPLSKL